MSDERADDAPGASLRAVLAEGFFSRLSFGIISFALPVYAYRKLGLSLTETGFLFSLNLVAEQLFKPLMGAVADRIGIKRAYTAAIGLRSVVALLLAFAASPLQVYVIRFLHGFSESLRDPSVNVLIAENARKKSLASAFGWYSSMKMSAGSLGKALGGLLIGLTAERYTWVFLTAFVLSFLPLYVVMRYVREPAHLAAAPDSAEAEEGKAGNGALLPVATLGFIIACTSQMISNLFPILAIEYAKLGAAETGLLYTISVVVVIGAGPVFGWISDRFNRKLVLMVRGVANTISSALYWAFPSFAGLAVGNILDATGKAAFRPAWGALMARATAGDRRRRARLMSYVSLGEGLGETIGPLLGGFLWNTWGIGVMLGSRVVLALVGEIYAVRVGIETQRHAKKVRE